jgi:integrase/recombinase XerD
MGGDPARVRVTGPLAEYASGFGEELSRVGYTENSTADQLRLLAHLSRWLAAEGLSAVDLTPAMGDAFLAARRAGYTLWLSRKALAPLLDYLRALDAAPPEPVVAPGPVEELLARYRGYLTSERGLTAATAEGYAYAVRPFLHKREATDGTLRLEDLAPRDIIAFVVAEVPGRRPGSVKLAVTTLRSFLGFSTLRASSHAPWLRRSPPWPGPG